MNVSAKVLSRVLRPSPSALLALGVLPDAAGAETSVLQLGTLCRSVEPGGGRILKCLNAHAAELSTTCGARLVETRAEAASECKEDIAKFCASVPQSLPRLQACLSGHKEKLSDQYIAFVATYTPGRKAKTEQGESICPISSPASYCLGS